MNTIITNESNLQYILEQTVSLAIVTDVTVINQLTPFLRAEMFTEEAFAFIYSTAKDLFDRGIPLDHISMDAAMRNHDPRLYKKYNGLGVLSEAFSSLRDTDNVLEYARELKSLYLRRQLITELLELQGMVSTGTAPVTDILREADIRLDKIRHEGVDDRKVKQVAVLAQEMLDKHRRMAEEGVVSMGISSGIYEFDYITGGLYNGEAIGIAGRPAHGKTAVSIHMALQIALRGIPVMFFTLEMSEEQMMNRIIASLTDISTDSLRKTGMNAAERNMLEQVIREKLAAMPLSIIYLSSPRPEDIRAHVMLGVKNGTCAVAFVDYLHLMNTDMKKSDNLVNAVGANTNAIKQLAVDANIPIVLVSQMNRDVDRRPDKVHLPVLADLRDSGVIEQALDVVAFVYRPDMHGITTDEFRESMEGVGKLLILKSRNSGTGQARFRFNKTFTKLSDYRQRA